MKEGVAKAKSAIKNWLHLFTTIGIYALIEEAIEVAIVYTLSAFISKIVALILAMFIGGVSAKMISSAIMFVIRPIIQKYTYKEGNDKMEKIKQIFNWFKSNKKTILGDTAVTGLTGVGITLSWLLDILPPINVDGVNITPILCTIAWGVLGALGIVGVQGKGLETTEEYEARVAKEKEEKAQAKAEAEAEKARIQEEKAKAEAEKARAEEEAKAKAEEEKMIAEVRAEFDKAKKLNEIRAKFEQGLLK